MTLPELTNEEEKERAKRRAKLVHAALKKLGKSPSSYTYGKADEDIINDVRIVIANDEDLYAEYEDIAQDHAHRKTRGGKHGEMSLNMSIGDYIIRITGAKVLRESPSHGHQLTRTYSKLKWS